MRAKTSQICRSKPVLFFVLAMVISSLLFLQGCGSTKTISQWLYSDYSVEPLPVGEIDKKCVIDAKTAQDLETLESKYCIIYRNDKVGKWLKESDDKCEAHMKTIYGNEALYNIFFGTLTNIFAGLGAVLADPVTKTGMAAGALFSNSQRSLVNESVYKTVIVTSITKKIRDDREKRKATILANLKDTKLSYIDYPVNFALADIQDYHYHCSFMFGLQKAVDEGTQDMTPQKILQVKRDLDEVDQKMKIRAIEIKKIYEQLTEDDINKDYFLKQLKTRREALEKELTVLQSSMTSPIRQPPSGAPDAPTGVSAALGTTKGEATVSFKAPASTGSSDITLYKVYSNSEIMGQGEKPPILVKGLIEGKEYTFTVTATNTTGEGPASQPSNNVKVPPKGAPGAPTDVSATWDPGTGQATVSFKAPASTGSSDITLYKAYSNSEIMGQGEKPPILVKGLIEGKEYTFSVTATNTAGEGLPSQPSNKVRVEPKKGGEGAAFQPSR